MCVWASERGGGLTCSLGMQSTFEEFDTDRSKSIELKELEEAIKSIGYCVPDPVLQLLMSKYDFTGQNRSISYDSFIEYVFFLLLC